MGASARCSSAAARVARPRRQPVPAGLARELRKLRDSRQPEPADPVFCGLAGGRLQQTTLADIIRRAATRAGISKHVTAHTLRHTAATWLRQELGDTRLVAEYLGHADLSTVARYAHVDRDELFDAAGRLEQTRRSGGTGRAGPARGVRRPRRSTERVESAASSSPPSAKALRRNRPYGGRLIGRARPSRGRRTALSDPTSGAAARKRRNRPLQRWPSRSARGARERRAALSAAQASRSCSLGGAVRGAIMTVPSNTSGPRKALMSLS